MGLIHHAAHGVLGVAHGAVNFVGHVLGEEEVEKRDLTAREEVRIYLYLQSKLPHLTSHYNTVYLQCILLWFIGSIL